MEAASTVVVTETNNNVAMEESKNNQLIVVQLSVDDGNNTTTAAAAATATTELTPKKKKNRVHVSKNNKPFVFYLNLAKRCIKQYNDVELSALGMAIPTLVTIADILKRAGLATEKKITISTVGSKEDEKGRIFQKAKLEIVLGKAEKHDKTTAGTPSKKATNKKA